MAKNKRFDVDAIRQAARGQWLDIIAKISGVDIDLLDGDHHPCPKCGGGDRFRAFKDCSTTGAVICNQCFSKENGDGFSTLAWLQGVDLKTGFLDVVGQVANFLGMAPVKDDDPEKDLKWREWAPQLAAVFCAVRKGITEEALLANGARMAMYQNIKVIALPIIGENLDLEHPVGWVVANAAGGPLPKYNKDGQKTGDVNWKTTAFSGTGFIGTHAVSRLAAAELVQVCWKCEGMSDFLSLFAAIPESDRDRHVCLTNAHGARQHARWMGQVLATANVCVVHDADEPGQAGAISWTQAIGAQQTEDKTTKNVQLPYEIAKTKGKDLRDWLNAGNTYSDLVALAERTADEPKPKKTATGEVDYSTVKYPYQERLLKKLQLEVLYEEESGAIRVFSLFNHKSSTIRQIRQLTHDMLIQICGPPAMEVITSDSPDGENTFSLSDARKAIALFASSARGTNEERGVGVWQGKDRFGHVNETVVLVNRASGARWNGDQVLRKIEAPRADGLVLDLGAEAEDWFDFATLERYMQESADYDWRMGVMDDAYNLFSRWRWGNQDVAPSLMVGLVMATWVQTLWTWRPLVSVVGGTNAGKSMLFEALAGVNGTKGIFGKLEFKSEKSTLAGITQGVSNTARIVLLDEFEKSKDRDGIFELLRVSSRGGRQSQGSSSGKAVKRSLQHIAWTASIESGLSRQPDINRFIRLDLLVAEEGKSNKLTLPSESDLETLGQKLLAIAVRCAIEARQLATELKSVPAPGIDSRSVESYSVPAAILSVASNYSLAESKQLLIDLLANVIKDRLGNTDQEELLSDILSATIYSGAKHGNVTIGQILESPALLVDLNSQMEAAGIRQLPNNDLFIVHKKVANGLLKGSPWERQRIDEILLRLDGRGKPVSGVQRVAGSPKRGVVIPIAYVDAWAPRETPDDSDQIAMSSL